VSQRTETHRADGADRPAGPTARFTTFRVTAAAALTLAGCEGGAPSSTFAPTRLIAFGDEASVIDAARRKYTVNGLNEQREIDCRRNPLWIQVVGTDRYGMQFRECAGDASAGVVASIEARPGARVLELTSQIDAVLASESLSPRVLVTVLAGSNDVLELYRAFPSTPFDRLLELAAERGVLLGRSVNRLADEGAKVVVVTVPDLGLSPYARRESAQNTDVDRAALLTTLTDRLNSAMRTTIYDDGRRIGVVLADVLIRNIVADPARYGIANVTDAVCTPNATLPNCNTQTLVTVDSVGTPASSATWLWADEVQLSPAAHGQLGSAAADRASSNPFGS
jgi:outer membrane lipase/esterase